MGIRDRRSLPIPLGVVLRKAHVPFLVHRVVVPLVRNRSHGHACAEDLRIPKHAVQRLRATTTPSPDRHSLRVQVGPLLQESLHSHGHIVGGVGPDLAIDDFSPVPPPWGRRPSRIHAQHHVALLSEKVVPKHPGSTPNVSNRLTGRFTVHKDKDRVPEGWVKVGRSHHPTIQFHAPSDILPEKLHRLPPDRPDSGTQSVVGNQRAEDPVVG